jgi:uncharacterized protein (DUF2267 family)
MDELSTEERHLAYEALRATLHGLRDRLTVTTPHQAPTQSPETDRTSLC